MKIGVWGISYKNAGIDIREKIAFTHKMKIKVMHELQEQDVSEVIILSTCNRTEIYFWAENLDDAYACVRTYCCDLFHLVSCDLFYYYQGEQALQHLFRVTCGLDSLVLGEDQILGQVKEAFAFAIEQKASKKQLNKIFRESITFAKRMKRTYKISENPLSVSSIAVKFVTQQVGSLENKKILLIGVGKIGKIVLQYLNEQANNQIYVTKRIHNHNHNNEKYQRLLNEFPNITLVPYENRYAVISNMDVVFSSTASPHVVIKDVELPSFNHKIVMMDMAVPRDIDQSIRHKSNVSVYDVDDLKKIEDENTQYRLAIAEKIECEIDKEIQALKQWRIKSSVDDTIYKLNKVCDEVFHETVDSINRKVPLSSKEEEKVEMLVKSCIRKMVQSPIKQIKAIDNAGEMEKMKQALEYLFQLEEEEHGA